MCIINIVNLSLKVLNFIIALILFILSRFKILWLSWLTLYITGVGPNGPHAVIRNHIIVLLPVFSDFTVFHSPVLGNCDVTQVSSICEDPLSECRPSSDGTGILSCECKFGTVMVEYNSTKKCGKLVCYIRGVRFEWYCRTICTFNKAIVSCTL